MKYEGWPDLERKCPLCGEPGCAIYRGYYTRFLFCPEMEFTGKVVIRMAYCKRTKRRFALLPDFVVRARRVSRISLKRLQECFLESGGRLQAAIDAWTEGLGEEFYVPLSSARLYLSLHPLVPP
jgi:hypothetical protein